MIYTLPRMIQEYLRGTNGNTSLNTLASDALNSVIFDLDNGQDKICDILLNHNPYLLSASFDLTLDGSVSYYIPNYIPFNYESILRIDDISGGTDTPLETMVSAWGITINIYSGDIVPPCLAWAVRDQYLEIPNDKGGKTLRVYYTRRPTGLFYGNATSGSTTTAVITTATAGEIVLETDYYNGMYLAKGTQVRRVTDFSFSGSAATFTVDAWSTACSTDEISLVSPLPTRYQKLIVDEAIRRAKVALDDDDSLWARLLLEDTNIAKSRVGKVQQQGPERIRKVPRH